MKLIFTKDWKDPRPNRNKTFKANPSKVRFLTGELAKEAIKSKCAKPATDVEVDVFKELTKKKLKQEQNGDNGDS